MGSKTTPLVFGLALFLFCASGQNTLTVPDEYSTIQAAIDAAQPGDTVFVRSGTYRENLTIGKPLQLVGEDRLTAWIEAGDPDRPVVLVDLAMGEVTIRNLTVRGGEAGFWLWVARAACVQLERIRAVDNDVGIDSTGTGTLVVHNSLLVDNKYGVYTGAANTELVGVEISRGTAGILLDGTGRTAIQGCLIGLADYAISAYTTKCGWIQGARAFGEEMVEGERNRVFGLKTDLCPPYPGKPWPEGFVDEDWRRIVGEALVDFDRGVEAYETEDYPTAASAFEQGLARLRDAPLPLLEAYFYQNLGVVYHELGRYDEALSKYTAARTVHEAQGLTVKMANVDLSMGMVYAVLGRYEEALSKYVAARELYIAHEMWVAVADVDVNIGIVYFRLGRYEEALAKFAAARAVYEAQGLTQNVADMDVYIGLVCRKLGRCEGDAGTTHQDEQKVLAPTPLVGKPLPRPRADALMEECGPEWRTKFAFEVDVTPVFCTLLKELSKDLQVHLEQAWPGQVVVSDPGDGSGKVLVVTDTDRPVLYLVRGENFTYHIIEGENRDTGIEFIAVGDLAATQGDELAVLVAGHVIVLGWSTEGLRTLHTLPLPSDVADLDGALVVADLNGDGCSDLVTTNGVFYQLPQGGFSSYVAHTSARRCSLIPRWPPNYDLRVVDVDGDGHLDIVRAFFDLAMEPQSAKTTTYRYDVKGQPSTVSYAHGLSEGIEILVQKDTGEFVPAFSISFPIGRGLDGGIGVGDITGDGLADIVLAGDRLLVFPQTTGGAFGFPTALSIPGSWHSPVVTDLTADGVADLLATESTQGILVLFPGSIDYGLSSPVLYELPSCEHGPRTIANDDIDVDSAQELAIVGDRGVLVHIIQSLTPPKAIPVTSCAPSLTYLPFVDMELQSVQPDFYIVPLGLAILEQDNEVRFPREPDCLATGDLDGDGRTEFVLGSLEFIFPVVYVFDPKSQSVRGVRLPRDYDWMWIATGDLKGEGKDTVAVCVDQDAPSVLVPHLSLIALIEMDPTPTIVGAVHLEMRGGGVAIADLNLDGLRDIVTAVGALYQLPGDSFQPFTPFLENPEPGHPGTAGVFISDVNNDGLPDVVRSFQSVGAFANKVRIEILYQGPLGRFEPRTLHVCGLGEDPHLAVGDISGDGCADVVVCIGQGILVWRQQEDTLKGPVRYTQALRPRTPRICDINGDGLNDLVVLYDTGDVVSGRIGVLYQQHSGELGFPHVFPTSPRGHVVTGPQMLVASQGQGGLDLISVAFDGVAVLPNAALLAPANQDPETLRGYWEARLDSAQDDLERALSLRKLGLLSFARGQYEEAAALLRASAEIKGSKASEFWRPCALLAAGDAYYALGMLTEALALWQEAYFLFSQGAHPLEGELSALRRLALVYTSVDDYRIARKCLCMSFKAEHRRGAKKAEAADANTMGVLYLLSGEYEASARWLGYAQGLNDDLQCWYGQALTYGNIGIWYAKQKDYEQAVAYLAQAKDMLQRVVPETAGLLTERDIAWMLDFNLGLAYEALGLADQAVAHYSQAIFVIEALRAGMRVEAVKAAFQRKTEGPYRRLIDLLYRLGRGSSAFPYTERCRARTFLDLLYQGGVKPEQFLGPEQGVVAGAVDPQAIDRAIAQALKSLKPNEAMLSYFVTDRGIYIWVIAWDEGMGTHVIQPPRFISYPRAQLQQDVIGLRQDLEWLAPVDEALASFYTKLLFPEILGKLPPGVDTLILIPSGPLWYVPFAALVMPDQPPVGKGLAQRPPYLVEAYTLAYLPSLASLAVAREEVSPARAVLGLANPTRSGETGVEAQQHPVLEEAVQGFARCYAGEARVYVREEAQETLAHREAQGNTVLAYACHGQFNPRVPLQSKLLLAPAAEPARTAGDPRIPDGDYHAWEVLLTDHRGVDLVILAACETLLPTFRHLQETVGVLAGTAPEDAPLTSEQLEQITSGDEVVGLVRAFLSTGAQSVLATLWQANPAAVEALLVKLAEHRLEGKSWAQALACAQRELLQSEAFAHPWFWAPYQLVGRW